MKKKLDKLILENKELASKILIAHQELTDESITAKKESYSLNEKKEKQVAKLISANKLMSEELAEAHKKLVFQYKEKGKRAEELIVINKELEQFVYANKELKQFAYIASHELKEPLRTIANFIQIINEDYSASLDGKMTDYLQTIDNSVKRMDILINSLLHFSRLGINKKLTLVDCKELIDSVISDLSAIIKSSGSGIEVSDMPELNIYEIEFRQIFQNLITNAIKFKRKGFNPKIKINAEKIDDFYKFSVSDNGIGIDPSHFDRIFDIFQRLHNTEEVFEGKGIGLAYCKKIVQFHQGEIWVESELGKGSTFYFTIPII